MRETCARVLAAALMMGAIATATGLPTLFESDAVLGRGLTAPPSSHQRSVRAPVLPTPARPPLADRPADALSNRRPFDRPTVVRADASHATVRASQPRPAGGGHSPLPKPEPKPETRELAATTPAPPTPAPSVGPPAGAGADGRGKSKKAKGGKGKGHGKKAGSAGHGAATPVPPVEVAPPAHVAEPEHGSEAKDEGHGKGHGKGHEKDHGRND